MAIICTLVFSMLRLVLSWIMQQLIDIASGEPNAIPLTSLVIIIIGYLIVFVFVFMLTRFSQPKYIKQAISCAIRIWADSWSCNCIREFDELYGAASNRVAKTSFKPQGSHGLN